MKLLTADPQYAFVPLLSVVLFGLPHGALDHLVPGRLGWGRRPLPVLGYCLLYAALAGLYLLAWRHTPRPTLRLALDLPPLTLGALALPGGLYLWAAPRVGTVEAFTAQYLALVVALMDLRPKQP